MPFNRTFNKLDSNDPREDEQEDSSKFLYSRENPNMLKDLGIDLGKNDKGKEFVPLDVNVDPKKIDAMAGSMAMGSTQAIGGPPIPGKGYDLSSLKQLANPVQDLDAAKKAANLAWENATTQAEKTKAWIQLKNLMKRSEMLGK